MVINLACAKFFGIFVQNQRLMMSKEASLFFLFLAQNRFVHEVKTKITVFSMSVVMLNVFSVRNNERSLSCWEGICRGVTFTLVTEV